jgi:hypothetical protein
MSNLFIILIIGVICVAGLIFCFLKAYDEEISAVEDAIKHAGEDNDWL